MTDPKLLKELQAEIAFYLDDIRKLFKNPKITLLVRNSDLEDGDCLLSDDDLDKAIEAIRHLQTKAAHVLPPTIGVKITRGAAEENQ